MLDNYSYHMHFYGGKKDYQSLRRMVETQLEKDRYDKSKADILSSGKANYGLAVSAWVKGKCSAWVNYGKCSKGDKCAYSHHPEDQGKPPSRKGKGKTKH